VFAGNALAVTTRINTSFEATDSPAYTVGNLVGQNGWSGFQVGSPTVLDVQNSVAKTGTQAVRFDTTNASNSVGAAWKVTAGSAATETQWVVKWDMRRDTSPANSGYGIGVYSNADWLGEFGTFNNNGTEVTYVVADPGTGPTLFLSALPAVPLGTWATYEIDLDYDLQQYIVKINGVADPTPIPFMAPATDFSDADFTARFEPAGLAYFDNLMITSSAVPEPASAGLLGLMLVGTALRVRRTS
jgi:hypothetical protein